MKTSVQFDNQFAKKHGIDLAIVFEFLDTLCRVSKAMNKQKMSREGLWWCNCPNEVLEEFMTYYSSSKIQAIIEKLVSKNLIKKDGHEYSTLLEGEQRREIVASPTKEVETKEKYFGMTKVVDGVRTVYEEKATNIVTMLIEGFQHVNPDYEKFYRHKSQRNALYRMLELYNPDILFFLVGMLRETNQEKYAPVIVSPLQLESKAASLIAFIQRNRKDDIDNSVIL